MRHTTADGRMMLLTTISGVTLNAMGDNMNCKLCDGQIRQTKYQGFCSFCWHSNDGDVTAMVGVMDDDGDYACYCNSTGCDCD